MKSLRILALCGLLAFSACKDEIQSPIPLASVFVQLDLAGLDSELVPVLSSKTIVSPRYETERGRLGFGGVLIVNGYGNAELINLYAFDAACPVEIDPSVRVAQSAEDPGIAVCGKCGAKYEIAYGTGQAISGTRYPLRAYSVVPRDSSGKRFMVVN